MLLTWFHLASRDVLSVHPRGDTSRPPAGVFATRSPARPNPIGLHEVEVLDVRGNVAPVGLRGLRGDRRDAGARRQAGPEPGRLRALVNLLIDYAEVISHPPDEHGMADLAARSGLEPEVFRRRYWEHRLPYDVGGSAGDYWATVFGRAVDADELELVVRRDVDNWMLLNHDTLDVLRAVHERGTRMALLSNAPHELADAIEALPELAFFDDLVFSARIGVAKPEPRAFHAALEVMGLPADEVVFVDDREVNVASAREVGLRARLYTAADALRADLLG